MRSVTTDAHLLLHVPNLGLTLRLQEGPLGLLVLKNSRLPETVGRSGSEHRLHRRGGASGARRALSFLPAGMTLRSPPNTAQPASAEPLKGCRDRPPVSGLLTVSCAKLTWVCALCASGSVRNTSCARPPDTGLHCEGAVGRDRDRVGRRWRG